MKVTMRKAKTRQLSTIQTRRKKPAMYCVGWDRSNDRSCLRLDKKSAIELIDSISVEMLEELGIYDQFIEKFVGIGVEPDEEFELGPQEIEETEAEVVEENVKEPMILEEMDVEALKAYAISIGIKGAHLNWKKETYIKKINEHKGAENV